MATGRYAPSPTGALHAGNLRTALLAWLFARSSGGRFLLRVDDLDPSDARPEHEATQLAQLAALGIDWDPPLVRQSDPARRAAHAAAVERLVAEGRTYPCWCSRREIREAPSAPHGPPGSYPGTCRDLTPAQQSARDDAAGGRPPALRLRAGGEVVAVDDRFHGRVALPVDDLVLRRNDGIVAYNLATVVDDADMGVEEVVRGQDLLESTPRQVLLARVLDLPVPAFTHVPLVVGPDGARLAKRHGDSTTIDLPLLAASLGLAEPADAAVTIADVLARFDPAAVPRLPWTWPGTGTTSP